MAGDNEFIFKLVDGSQGGGSPQSSPSVVPSAPPSPMPGGGPGASITAPTPGGDPGASVIGNADVVAQLRDFVAQLRDFVAQLRDFVLMKTTNSAGGGPGPKVEGGGPGEKPSPKTIAKLNKLGPANVPLSADEDEKLQGSDKAALAKDRMGQMASEDAAGAAGGGAAIALAIVAAEAKAVAVACKALGDGLSFAGHEAAKLAGNDNMGALTGAVDAAANVMGKIPIVGQAFAAEIGLMSTALKAGNEVLQSFVRRANQLAFLSPQISMATSQASVRSLQGDIREEQAIGPELAKLVELDSKASDEFRQIMLPIKKIVAEAMVPIMEKVIEFLGGFKVGMVVLTTVARELPGLLQSVAASLAAGDTDEAKRAVKLAEAALGIAVRNATEKQPEIDLGGDLDGLLKNVRQARAGGQFGRQIPGT